MKKFAKKTISHSGSVEAYCRGCTPCSCNAACACNDASAVFARTSILQDPAYVVADNQAWRIDAGK